MHYTASLRGDCDFKEVVKLPFPNLICILNVIGILGTEQSLCAPCSPPEPAPEPVQKGVGRDLRNYRSNVRRV